MSWLRFGKIQVLLLALVLLAGFALSDGAATVSAVDKDEWYRDNTACWVTGPVGSDGSPGESDVPGRTGATVGIYPNDNWGSIDEFVVDMGDLVDYPDSVSGQSFAPGNLGGSGVDAFSKKYRDGLGIGLVDGAVSYVFYHAGRPFDGVALGVRWKEGFPFSGLDTGDGKHYVSGVSFPGVETRINGTQTQYRFTSDAAINYVKEHREAIRGARAGGAEPHSKALAKSYLTIIDSLGRPVGYFNTKNIKKNKFYDVPDLPNPAEFGNFRFETRSLFKNFPEAVDYTFALDVMPGAPYLNDTINDVRIEYLTWLLRHTGNTTGRPEYGRLVPWRDIGDYLQRRPVAKIANERITEFSAFWINPENPDGGSRHDQVENLIEQRAFWADVQASTRTTAGGAGRELTGQQDYAGINMTSQVQLTCVGTSCTSQTNSTSTPVTVVGTLRIVDRNVGESDFVDLVQAQRPMVWIDEVTGLPLSDTLPVDPSAFGAGNANYRDEEGAGYGALFMENTNSDRIQVTVELNREFREDYKFHGGKGFGDPILPAFGFGDSVWTYDYVTGGRLYRLNQPFSGLAPDLIGVQEHYGYRQPLLSRAYYCPGSSFNNNGCLDDATTGTNRASRDATTPYDPVDINGTFTDRNVRDIKWPVNLQDMNWYLYQLPGKGPESSDWLLWVHNHGGRQLIHSGYGVSPATSFPSCKVEGEQMLPGGNVLPGDLLDSKNIECISSGPPSLNIEDDAVWNIEEVADGLIRIQRMKRGHAGHDTDRRAAQE